MERVDQASYAKREPIRSACREGLRGLFPACKEPLPPKIEQLLNRLREVFPDAEIQAEGMLETNPTLQSEYLRLAHAYLRLAQQAERNSHTEGAGPH
jgi:hypothetical protein